MFYFEGTLNSNAAVEERRRVCQKLGILKECHAKYVIDVVTTLPCSNEPVSQQEETMGNKRSEEDVEEKDEEENKDDEEDNEDKEEKDEDDDDEFMTPPPTPSYKRRPLTQKLGKRRKTTECPDSQHSVLKYFFSQ